MLKSIKKFKIKVMILLSFLMKKTIYFVSVFFLLFTCSKNDYERPDVYQSQEITERHQKYDIFIPRGGNLFTEMTKLGLSPNQVVELTLVFGNNVDFRAVQPNDHFQLVIDIDTSAVIEFNYLPDIVTTHKIIRNSETEEYFYILEEREIIRRMVIIEGVVYTTLIQALTDNNVDDGVKYSVANALSSRINFSAHTRSGDTFRIMYEERHFDGNRVPGATLYYVSYNGRTAGFHEGFRYREDDDRSVYNGMFTAQGVSMVTANYRHPLDRIHVTSPYGMRFHPISRKWLMHNGIDYRGALGTPVYAVQGGRVIMAGWNGGFGNTVEIQHENNYVTQYAHLHRVSVRHGQRVNRGTVIGAVGSTGVSTGPHLHFGLRVNGRWQNPSNLRMVSAVRLEGKRLDDFNKQIIEIKNTLSKVEMEMASPFEMTEYERYRRVNAKKI